MKDSTKRTGAKARAPQPAGYSCRFQIAERGLPYTRADRMSDAPPADRWAAERAAALVSVIMPEDGFEHTFSADEVGAALAEIVGVLCYTDDMTDRENMHTALVAAIFDKTTTHAHNLDDFSRRRLIFPRER